ncbi:oxidoreductase, short chain dehydrogenase/reductase family protein, partial [Oesophagostomum dentatum]
MPIQCNEALSNSCPSGYSCTFNALVNSHVCCGASDYGVCPEGEKAFVSTSDMSPRECVINVDASCPANYLCRFSMHKNKYFCCASVSGKTCPMGKFLHRDSQSSLPTRCTMGRAEQCPDGYSCQSYLPNAAQGFCCTNSSVCPDDEEFVIDEHSQLPRACTMGSFVGCPNGFACRSLTSAVEGFCCRDGLSVSTPTSVCPNGRIPYLLNGEPQRCTKQRCPRGYDCTYMDHDYVCCSSAGKAGRRVSPPAAAGKDKDDHCAHGNPLIYPSTRMPVICVPGKKGCPSGYACKKSASSDQYICCSARFQMSAFPGVVMTRFDGKVVIVTGSSSGIGAETALLFAKEGAKVTITGRKPDGLEATKQSILNGGVKEDNVNVVIADITDAVGREKVISSTVEKFGGIDILVNNAGGLLHDGKGQAGASADVDVLQKTMDLNVYSAIQMVQLARPHLAKAKGEVVNISSIAGQPKGAPRFLYYCMAKGALDQMTRGLAVELIAEGIRVNSVSPGAVVTHFAQNAGMTDEQAGKMYETFTRSADALPIREVGQPDD